MSDFKGIWETLSNLDLSSVVEKKMGLAYLSWANAWDVVMSHYPAATFEILDPVNFDDGSMEVWCSVTIDGHIRKMWLPVMDHRNNSIKCPTSRQVSDARMRCLVKCLAMFGLGLYIYRGEDLPKQDSPEIYDQNSFMGSIQALMSQDSIQSLTSEFKRLTKGHNPQSAYVTKLKQAATNRKEELNNAA